MRELFAQTWQNLSANKLRSFLTMFGIIWGVISIVLLSAVATGFQLGNKKVLEGARQKHCHCPQWTHQQAGWRRARRSAYQAGHRRRSRRSRKLKAARTHHAGADAWRREAKSDFNASSTQLSGVWPVYQTIRTIEVDRGRLINEEDNREARRVVVIGFDMCKQLFADRDPVGQTNRTWWNSLHDHWKGSQERAGFELHWT